MIGCQRDALLGPTGEATLQVEVGLRGGAHRTAADTTATIDRIRVRAVELKAGAETIRASRDITVRPEDETWSVVLKVAAADRYRIEVEMDGIRSFGSGLSTEHGLLYAGEGELNDLCPTRASRDRAARRPGAPQHRDRGDRAERLPPHLVERRCATPLPRESRCPAATRARSRPADRTSRIEFGHPLALQRGAASSSRIAWWPSSRARG
ncbi:MAG: hypothetical protein U0527_14035 [Candidatus Eisenbacteria bacterium]